MKYLFVAFAFLISGCATTEQTDFNCFLALGARVQGQTDELLFDQSYTCDKNLRTRFGCQVEGDKWAVVADHMSSVLCGGVNNKPELYEMNVWIQREFFGE